MGKVPQQTVIVMTAAVAVTIIMLISTLATVMPQAVYAQQDNRNPSSLSSDVDDNCASDELPTSIDGTIRCIKQGECYSSESEFDGEKVKHCNFMMSSSDELLSK